MAKPNLTDALGVVNEFYAAILEELSAEQKRSADEYAAILAKFPESARTGQIYQCAAQMGAGSFNYQLSGLRQQFGLDTPTTPMAPMAPITPAPTPTT